MRDPEFEKQVHRKLEELQFVPSADVWTKVEKEIKNEKRRKPLFWIFLLSGMMLVGGTWLFITGNKNEIKIKSEKAKIANEKNPQKSNTLINPKDAVENNKDVSSNSKKPGELKIALKQNDALNENRIQGKATTADRTSILRNNVVFRKGNPNTAEKNSRTRQSVPFLVKNNTKKTETKNEAVEKGNKRVENEKSSANDVAVSNNNISDEKKNDTEPGKLPEINKTVDSSGAKNITGIARETKVTDSPSIKAVAVKDGKKSKLLHLGFTAGGGASDIENKSRYLYLVSSTGGFSTGANDRRSPIQAGVSFYAGAFLEKSLSKKISLSAGINYHYYSTSMRTGKSGDSVVYVFSAPANNYLTSTLPVPQNSYYTSGTVQTYFSHYHFIEVPVLVNYQVNKSQKLPIVWQAGLSLSYLISTNALQFDPFSGVYYKNNSLFNKTQLNLTTGFAIGFYHKNNLFRVGPEIGYGATKFLNNSADAKQHFLYTGLKLSLIPQKK